MAYVKDGAARPIIIPVGKKDLPKHVVSIVLKQIAEAETDARRRGGEAEGAPPRPTGTRSGQ